ncbi:hypothetical protein [Rhizobium tibeticum]|nr:hypothetical protein [Rhizobium tibeticum]
MSSPTEKWGRGNGHRWNIGCTDPQRKRGRDESERSPYRQMYPVSFDLLVDIFYSLARVLAAFTMAVVRFGFATTWHSLQAMKIAALMVIDAGGLPRELCDGRPQPRSSTAYR